MPIVTAMRTLYHLPLDPGCRMIRILLQEKGLDFELEVEKVWERRGDFLAINPAGTVPVLQEDGDVIIAGGAGVIAEYLEEVAPEPELMGHTALERAEVRRLVQWFDGKFRQEVTANLVDEKMLKRFLGLGHPDSKVLRTGHANIHYHLDYIAWLCDRRSWLAGDDLTLADIAAGAHLSALDYLADVPWKDHKQAREWYARFKSRPSMRGVLMDMIPGAPPPKHYSYLDF